MSEPQDASAPPRRPSCFDSAAARSRYGLDTSAPTAGTPPLPSISPGASLPSTPRGQLGRPLSGTWNSPGGSFRADDEVFVLELGARYLRAGFGGLAAPRARMGFGPDTQTRAGDYSAWLPSSEAPGSRRRRPDSDDMGDWAAEQQLYPLDLRAADMQLISLKLERAVRVAAINHLLAVDDSKRRVVALAIQPQLPHPLLKEVLDTLFAHFPSPYQIAMLSTPLCSTVAAGLRSAIVVDIGWHETLVSAVYEMRELEHRRSERGMRRLNWAVSKLLVESLDGQEGGQSEGVTFDDCEEVIWRMCHSRRAASPSADDPDTTIAVALPSLPAARPLPLPFSAFSRPVEDTFFSAPAAPAPDDDNLTPLPALIYTTLLRLPPDVRGALLPRILITGGGAHLPRLKARLTADVAALIAARGWDPVRSYGSARRVARIPVRLRAGSGAADAAAAADGDEAAGPPSNKDVDPASTTPASQQPPLADEILAKIRRSGAASGAAEADGKAGVGVRAVRTLGAWAGASLLSGLRQRGVVEVDKDAFMAHGLSGADREAGSSVAEEAVKRRSREQEKRQSMIAGGRAGERRSESWTLGAWA